VDVFTPIHDDPQTQGRIVACNATNDIFAMGVTKLVSLQAILAYPEELPEVVAKGVLEGMSSFMKELGANLSGGQTITNPCPLFGGVALGVAHPNEIVYSKGARPGDSVLLTKPLGIQPAMRSYRDLQDENRKQLLDGFLEEKLLRLQEVAVRVMTKSNLEVAQAMQEVGVSAATDVTGFGLLGHAANVSALSGVDIVIDSLPTISGALGLAEFYNHKLSTGMGAETAGGMLVFVDADRAEAFRTFLKKKGLPCWIVGRTDRPEGTPSARLAGDVEYIETDFP
jgi:selenide,water dikinase